MNNTKVICSMFNERVVVDEKRAKHYPNRWRVDVELCKCGAQL
jgi:hypothetical protein